MPTYCYTLPNGVILERQFSIGQAPDEIDFGGQVAKRDTGAEMRGYQGAVRFSNKPGRIFKSRRLFSEAMSCQPDQVAEANAAAKKFGINCHYHPDGTVELASESDRKRLRRNLFGDE